MAIIRIKKYENIQGVSMMIKLVIIDFKVIFQKDLAKTFLKIGISLQITEVCWYVVKFKFRGDLTVKVILII